MVTSGVDTKALQAFLAKVRSVAGGAVFERIKRQAAAEALSLTLRGFQEGRNPYGEAWEPLKLREGGKPLLDTGRLRASFATEVTGEGFRIGSNLVYAPVQQFGATIVPKRAPWLRFSVGRGRGKRWFRRRKVVIPARPMLPTGARPAPAWTEAFLRVLEREVRRVLG